MNWNTKHRPKRVADLVGQPWCSRVVSGALEHCRTGEAPAMSWLITGGWGQGKTTYTRIIGKALACETPTPEGEACCACQQCMLHDADASPNYTEIDAPSHSGVDDIRALIQDAHSAPTGAARYRILALDEAHSLTKPAQTAFLKTLEEPPHKTHILLITTDPDRLHPTIKSRCTLLNLEPIKASDLTQHLAKIAAIEGVKHEPEALTLIAVESKGHVRDAIKLLQQTALTGPVTVAAVKKSLHLDAADAIVDLLEVMSTSWSRAYDRALALLEDHPPPDLFNTLSKALSQAEAQRVRPSQITDTYTRLINCYGDKILTAAEWMLTKSSTLCVRTSADFIVVLSMIANILAVKGNETTKEVPKMTKPRRFQVTGRELLPTETFIQGLGVKLQPETK